MVYCCKYDLVVILVYIIWNPSLHSLSHQGYPCSIVVTYIHTSNCKITTCYTPIQASSLYSHINTHIHILYTKLHIQSRYQDFQQTNFPFPLSTIMDRLPVTHIIDLSILIFLEIVQKLLSSNLLRFYSCLFYLFIYQHVLIRN